MTMFSGKSADFGFRTAAMPWRLARGGLVLVAVSAMLAAAPPARAGLLDGVSADIDIGSKDSLASADVDIGGIGVDASVASRDSLADVDATVGSAASADATVGGRDSLASVDARVGDTRASATVGSRDSLADVSVGSGGGLGGGTGGGTVGGGTSAGNTGGMGSTSGTGGTGGTGGTVGRPGSGVVIVGLPDNMPSRWTGALTCAKGGNTSAFNGMPLMDRRGAFIGYVHSVQIDPSAQIASVRVATKGGGSCATIANGGFSVSKGQMRAAFNGANNGLSWN